MNKYLPRFVRHRYYAWRFHRAHRASGLGIYARRSRLS